MFKGKRLSKELLKIHEHLPPGITLVNAPDLNQWVLDIQVLDDNPLYKDRVFRLNFRFSEKYPIEAPEVYYMTSTAPPRSIPMHPHVYSNGIICLDLLGNEGWSPVQNVESVCMSLQSMLASNTKNERPPGDEDFCRRTRPGMSTRHLGFVYEDDTV